MRLPRLRTPTATGIDRGTDLVAVDWVPQRIRRPLDPVRLVVLFLAMLLLVAFGTIASGSTNGANEDLTRLLSQIPTFFVHALSLVGRFGALLLPLALVVREIVRNQEQRLVEAIITGLVSVGVVALLNLALSTSVSTALHNALTQAGTQNTLRPLDAYIAALFAFVVVVGVAGDPFWRSAFWIVTGVYVVSTFAAAQASALSLVASPALGAFVGIAVRYIAGSVNQRPDVYRIADVLRQRDLAVVRIIRVPSTAPDHRRYEATLTTGGQLDVLVLDRDLIASGAVYNVYRRLRLSTEISAPPALSLERVAEHRALLAYTAASAGVRTPLFIAGVPCGPDALVLAYELMEATPLTDPTDAQLDELWSNVQRLHRARITHRGVTAEHLATDADGRVVLPILVDGAPFASELRITLDRAQVLIATAQLVGAERAVRVARTVLSGDKLAEVVPMLQPIALSRDTRTAVRHDSELLESLREELRDQVAEEPATAVVRVERFRPRAIVSIVALLVAAYFLVGQLATVDVLTVLSSTRWTWVPLVVLASAGTYLSAAIGLMGFVREKLSFGLTVLAQLAASFVGFVAPPSVGGVAINIRYLRKAKVSATGAATSVGTSQVINAVLHFVLLIVMAAATGTASDRSLPLPGWAFLALGVVAVVLLVLLSIPSPRRWLLALVLPPIREALPRLLNLLTSPTKLAQALVGGLGLNACYIAALYFAVVSFDGNLSFPAVAVVYLAGAAVASAAPTPGGLGAVEVALSTGLAAASMPSTAAVSAVLLFRLATFWLPVPLGYVAMHALQRRDAL